MKEKITLIFLIALILTGCKNDVSKNDVLILTNSIKQLQTDNDEFVNEIKIKKNGSASVEPYYNLSSELNNLIDSFISKHSSSFISKIDSSEILKLNKDYQTTIDRIKKSYSFKLLMPMDDSLLLSIQFNKIESSSGSEELNNYLTLQTIILKHRSALKIFQSSISVCYLWFTKFDDLGYMVNVSSKENDYTIKIHYDYPKRYAEYNLISLESLENLDKEKIQIKNLHYNNDTLSFNVDNSNKPSLIAMVKYKVIKCTGEIDTVKIEMPFTLK